MNKIIGILLILIALSAGSYFFLISKNSNDPIFNNLDDPSPTQTEKNDDTITFEPSDDKKQYKVDWLIVRDPSDIHLYSNLNARFSSQEALSENNCVELVNGGFYTTDDKHIGLFITDGNKISESRQSLTFSGYFYIQNNQAFISEVAPQNARLAVQSGPLIWENGQAINIQTQDDEYARRVVVATTSDNEVIFLVLYEASSVYSGPRLDELPDLLNDVQQNRNIEFESALNLDGGSASAFLTKFVQLSEFSTIGSYFCVRTD